MKKSTLITGILFLSMLFLNACSKKDQLSPVHDPTEQISVATFSTPLFEELNETIARFDPLYLQIVYKDKRTKSEINDEALRLLAAINQNPTSLVIQKELTDLYHFNNFADLQAASNLISNHSSALKKSFLGQDSVLSKAKLHQLNEARNNFLKNKISSLKKASQKSSNGLWTDNAQWILDHFHFYSQLGMLENVQVDEMDDGSNFGNGGNNGECRESCCFEFQACQVRAVSDYRSHIIMWTSGGVIGGASAGFAAGSIIPIVGSLWGAIYGGWGAGTAGYALAVSRYMSDLEVCVLNYKACIQRKKGN